MPGELDRPSATVLTALQDVDPECPARPTLGPVANALRLEDGRVVRGFAGAVEQERLKALLGTEGVVEGWFYFRPSWEALNRSRLRHAGDTGDAM